MSEHGTELRGIAWSQVFPFLRLFSTFKLAIDAKRLGLALACVLIIYTCGRILDWVWISAGGGVNMLGDGRHVVSEIHEYGAGTQSAFNAWVAQAVDAREQIAVNGLINTKVAATPKEAREKLASDSLKSLLVDTAQKDRIKWAHGFITERLAAGQAAIDDDKDSTDEQKADARRDLIGAADTLRYVLTGDGRFAARVAEVSSVVNTIVTAGSPAPTEQPANRERLATAVGRQAILATYNAIAPTGPFITLAEYEANCFAAAIQGVCTGRIGYAGGAFDREPSLIGSIASAWRGAAWLVTQRSCFAVFYGILHLLIFAFFGGAICRSAAIQSARDESISLGTATRFACDKYGSFLLAPAMPVVAVIAIAVIIWLGSLIGLIPYLGELITGAGYVLPIIGGFTIALLLLGTVLAFNLMWPTIAVEANDGFDALSRSCSYVGSRAWHYGFYSIVLLIYGALSFVFVRLIVLVTLKTAYLFTHGAINWYWWCGSDKTDGVGKFDAMWRMPAWADLSLLPRPDGPPLVGTFFNAPTSLTEWVGAGVIAFWVFLLLGLLVAFCVNFFFCGSVQMYFLLRRDVDATDYEEIYYEEPEAELPPVTAPVAAAPPQPEPPHVDESPSSPPSE